MKLELISAYDRIPELSELIREYTDAILAQGDDVRKCLAVQHLDEELRDLPRKYAPPYSRLYLAVSDNGTPAGCAALLRNDEEFCELKRLYVRPAFRGLRLGSLLLEKAIGDARSIGYKHIRLDTFPSMETAIRLYETYGFYRIGKYNDNPAETAVFMQLDL